MSQDPQAREEDRKFKTLQRIITAVVIVFILAAVAGIIYLVRSGDKLEESALGELDKIVIEDDKVVAEAVDEIVHVPETESTDTMTITDEPPVVDTPVVEEAQEPAVTEEPVETESEETETEAEPAADEETADTADEGDISSTPVSFSSYTVAEGDTVNKIAASYGLLPETVIGVNDIADVNDIRVGTRLQIPDRDGQMYTVKAGDSLSVIAYEYGMGYVTLADVNGLKSSLIQIGQKLFIPDRTISREDYQIVMNTLFVEPAEGRVAYGYRSIMEDIITGEKEAVDGIYIKNDFGTSVVAANTGTVIAVENNQSDLGRYIIIDHDNGYQTVYGHLDRLYVEVGISVEQGDEIGTMGQTGRVLESMLFFQVTKDGVPMDPETFF